MPKIIAEINDKILECTKRMMLENQNDNFSLRMIAKECGIAVGTIYNYFENKEMLIAKIHLEDWKKAMAKIDEGFKSIDSLKDGIMVIYSEILDYCNVYGEYWNQYQCSTSLIKSRHHLVQSQIAEKIDYLFDLYHYQDEKDMSVILAEIVLVATVEKNITKEQLEKVIVRLFR